MKTFEEFIDQFKFNPSRNLFVGIERECHLVNSDGNIVPIAVKVLDHLGFNRTGSNNGHFGYELSACQIEWRAGPCRLINLTDNLKRDENILKQAEEKLGFTRSFDEVAPEDMPLDVYPDPTGRYQEITKNMPRRVLSAACRVIATHIHIGMPNPKTALRAYNKVIEKIDYLCEIGDHSDGKRLEIYKIMAPNYLSPHYKSWSDFYDKAVHENFTEDPRSCWTLIRISKHGTIEFRMFGATEDLNEILYWACFCRKICQ